MYSGFKLGGVTPDPLFSFPIPPSSSQLHPAFGIVFAEFRVGTPVRPPPITPLNANCQTDADIPATATTDAATGASPTSAVDLLLSLLLRRQLRHRLQMPTYFRLGDVCPLLALCVLSRVFCVSSVGASWLLSARELQVLFTAVLLALSKWCVSTVWAVCPLLALCVLSRLFCVSSVSVMCPQFELCVHC